MIRASVEIEGLDDIIKRLGFISEDVALDILVRAAEEGARELTRMAKEAAPVKKGKGGYYRDVRGMLRQNINYEKTDVGRRGIRFKIGPSQKAFYGLMVEKGHKLVRGRYRATKKVIGTVPPHPFLAPVLKKAEKNVVDRMADVLRRELSSV